MFINNYLLDKAMRKKAIISYFEGDYKKIQRKCIDYGFEVEIYNNSESNIGKKVKNIGVDAYDKFLYIVENYNELPNIILFLTDNIYKCQKKIRRFEYILENHYLLYDRPGIITGHISKINEQDLNFKINEYKNITLVKSSIRPFHKWFNHFINGSINPSEIYICKKSIFALTNDLIHTHSKDFYLKLLKHIEEHSFFGHDSEVPHYFERSYISLFSKNDPKLLYHDFRRYKNFKK